MTARRIAASCAAAAFALAGCNSHPPPTTREITMGDLATVHEALELESHLARPPRRPYDPSLDDPGFVGLPGIMIPIDRAIDWSLVLGRFDVVLRRSSDSTRRFEVEVVGIGYEDVESVRRLDSAAYFRSDPRPFRVEMIARLELDPESPDAAIRSDAEIWTRWENARILALFVAARPVPAADAASAPEAAAPTGNTAARRPPKDRWRRLVSIERALWPGPVIDLAATDEGLVLRTPRVNVPSAEAREPKP